MITRDEALELARGWAADLWSEDTPELGLHEFGLGWVAWPILPAPQDPAPEASSTFRLQIVIDRETGDLADWPSIPVSVITERYTAMKAAGDRFPPDVRMVLEDAGWFPGRDITAEVDQWEVQFAEELAEVTFYLGEQLAGLTFFPAARAAMREFGGLTFGQAAAPDGGYHSYIFPTGGGIGTDRLEGFLENHEHPVFPLGNNQDGSAELVIDKRGRVFFLHWAKDLYLGANIDAALVSLVRWNDWPDVYSSIWENDNGDDQPPSAGWNSRARAHPIRHDLQRQAEVGNNIKTGDPQRCGS